MKYLKINKIIAFSIVFIIGVIAYQLPSYLDRDEMKSDYTYRYMSVVQSLELLNSRIKNETKKEKLESMDIRYIKSCFRKAEKDIAAYVSTMKPPIDANSRIIWELLNNNIYSMVLKLNNKIQKQEEISIRNINCLEELTALLDHLISTMKKMDSSKYLLLSQEQILSIRESIQNILNTCN